ncbi:MAG: family 2 glycosyl transferase [Bacteroidetes bacterium]|nr:family 2 glycosyl transferase [Bacteroidota bacterium]
MPISDQTSRWFSRFGYQPPGIVVPEFRPGTRLMVVIPALAEPELDRTLQSLHSATLPGFPIDILVVVNHPEGATPGIIQQSQANLTTCKAWEHRWQNHDLRLITIHAPDLPSRHAGAGLSRKIGLDLAVLMADGLANHQVILANLDADCTVSDNYFISLSQHFATGAPDGASLYFEHDLSLAEDGLHRQSIIEYELYLRYYIRGLRFAGYPFAFHTVGSSMAVTMETYLGSGGMNRRKAGEDFYFLHKIIPNGRFTDLTSATVFPSPRPSWRVPFGTGRTISNRLETGSTDYQVYSPAIFKELRSWISGIHENGLNPLWWNEWEHHAPPSIATFLIRQNFSLRLTTIFNNSSTPGAALQGFWRWMDGFAMLKLVHHLRDEEHGTTSVEHAAFELLNLTGKTACSGTGPLLSLYRALDKAAEW